MTRRTWLAMLVIAGNAPLLRAQSRPVFEVASVKAATQRQGLRLDSGRYSDTADLSTFIVMAYGLSSCYAKVSTGAPCPLMAGMLPAWASSTFPSNANLFAIEARLPNDPRIASGYTAEQVHTGKVTQLSLMLQALLEDRFHLNVHREQKEIPVYALTPVRNGAKLKPATSRELTEAADGTSVEHHGMSAFEPVLAPDGSRTGRRRIAFQGASMEQAADVLASYMDRPVVDRTGLKGDYDFKIEYAVDQDASDRSGGMMRNLLSGLSCSELTAGLENSGLRCEAAKAQVEVLVVDGVERPTEN